MRHFASLFTWVLLSIFSVVSMASAATLNPFVNNLYFEPADGVREEVTGSGLVPSDGVLSFGVSNLEGAFSNQGNLFNFNFGFFCAGGNCGTTTYELVFFDNGPSGPFFLAQQGPFNVVEGLGPEFAVDFNSVPEFALDIYFENGSGAPPDVAIGWAFESFFDGPNYVPPLDDQIDLGLSEVPLPASAWLLIAAIGGLFGRKPAKRLMSRWSLQDLARVMGVQRPRLSFI